MAITAIPQLDTATPMNPGPDLDFPYLGEFDRFTFPDPLSARGNIVAVGGNLSPGMLLSAYEQGIFPWFSEDDPIIWQSPDPRCVIFPDKLHCSQSMKKILSQGIFEISCNRDFAAVINACGSINRPGQDGTWITEDMIKAYIELFHLGYACSAEAWQHGTLAGGCYGLLMRGVFFGESMFSQKPNASKAAFLTLAQNLFFAGVKFIDCQVPTPHLYSLGGEKISRAEYLTLLAETLAKGH